MEKLEKGDGGFVRVAGRKAPEFVRVCRCKAPEFVRTAGARRPSMKTPAGVVSTPAGVGAFRWSPEE